MSLGMEVGLGPGDIALHGTQLSSPKRGLYSPPPIFCPCLLWLNVWMHQDATWYAGRPPPRSHCVRWDPVPSSPPKKGHNPQFWARVCCGQTVAHLSYCWALVVLIIRGTLNTANMHFP